MTVVAVIFWVAIGLIVYTHVGYPLLLRALVVRRRARMPASRPRSPSVSLIVAAHNEGDVIEEKVQNMLALDYPPRPPGADRRVRRLRRIERSPQRAVDVTVLDLPRRGKVHAQDAAVESATGEILAFSDANAFWDAECAARAGAAVRGPAGRLRVRAAVLPRAGRVQPGGRVLALRELGARGSRAASAR